MPVNSFENPSGTTPRQSGFCSFAKPSATENPHHSHRKPIVYPQTSVRGMLTCKAYHLVTVWEESATMCRDPCVETGQQEERVFKRCVPYASSLSQTRLHVNSEDRVGKAQETHSRAWFGACQLPGDDLACLANQQGIDKCPPCSFRCPLMWGSLSWRSVRIEGWKRRHAWEGDHSECVERPTETVTVM